MNPLPGRWITVDGRSRKMLHPQRPWLLVEREAAIAYINLDNGRETVLLDGDDTLSPYVWVGDCLVCVDLWEARIVLLDGHGNGIVESHRPDPDAQSDPRPTPARRRAVYCFDADGPTLQVSFHQRDQARPDTHGWHHVLVHDDADGPWLQPMPWVSGSTRPIWHPDGHDHVRIEHVCTDAWRLELHFVSAQSTKVVSLTPRHEGEMGLLSVGWIGPDAFSVVTRFRQPDEDRYAFDLVTPSTGECLALDGALGAHTGVRQYAHAPDGASLALLVSRPERDLPELVVVDLRTGETRVASSRFRQTYDASRLLWLSSDTLAWVANLRSDTEVAAHVVVWSFRTGSERVFTLDKLGRDTWFYTVLASDGRLLLTTEVGSTWRHFFTERFVDDGGAR